MKRILILVVMMIGGLSVWGEITATVRPGYTFKANERPTTATLNALGRPDIEITGTLGGTNVALGAATVSGTMLMDSVAGDDGSLTWDSGSPRGLIIADAGVRTNALDPAAFGRGIVGGDTATNTDLKVNVLVDTNLITINATNQLTLGALTNFSLLMGDTNNLAVKVNADASIFTLNGTNTYYQTNAGSSNTLTLRTFTSYDYPITGLNSNGVMISTNHSLGVAPKAVRWVLVCTTGQYGYAAGDEVDLAGNAQNFSLGANATNVFLVKGSGSSAVRVFNQTTGAAADIAYNAAANWVIRCYARP